MTATLRYYAAFALDPVGFVGRRFERYGDGYHAESGDGGLFVLRHPDHLHEVLATKASSFTKQHSAFTQLSRVLGDGLLTSDGETWTRQRRMIGPAFAPARMADYGAVMTAEALETARQWGRGGRRAVGDDLTALTLRVVSRALFGHDVAPDDIEVVARAMAAFQRSLTAPDVLPSWLPSPTRRRLEHHGAALDRLMYRLIEERRAHAGGERRDLLERLVTAVDPEGDGGGLTVEEVRDQIVTLFLAGHETTAHALGWAFYCLARNPGVEAALHAELDRVLAGRPPAVEDLESLPYLDRVVSETLRMYPPVYAIARRAREDVVIGDWDVPRGSEVILWVYWTQRDARFFPRPESFEPERFAAPVPKRAYLPFGAGPRACIGRSFATMEARLLLATLAQRYRVALPSGRRIDVRPRITLTPKRPIELRVTPR